MDELPQAASVPMPNMEDEARKAMVTIYKMGMLHAAFDLRGTDFLGIPDEHVDVLARYIEGIARQDMRSLPEWKLPDDWPTP